MVSNELPRYQRLVDGFVLPVAVGGHPVLDFCNTRAGWGTADPREYLASYDQFVVWAREAGLVDPALAERLRGLDRGNLLLPRALKLRSALYQACIDPSDDAAVDVVAAEARTAIASSVLIRGRGWSVSDEVGLELPLLELARAAGDFLSSTDLATVGRCPGHDCGWLFLDPRGRRRWCVMAVCGNREKARRHARRSHG
jgi:predicted RNA-binding Zn ribbon-like protein